MTRGGKKTVIVSATVGAAEMKMLKEIVEACGFLTMSEAVRAVIRYYYETKLSACKADGLREAV